jgi:hypothetical protein
MSGQMGNTAESDLLKLLFQNTNWANLGDATGLQGSGTAGSFYIELSTGALTGSSAQNTTEAAYTGYGRVAVARSSGGWTITGSSPTTSENAAAITFGACTAGSETEQAASIGRDSSGAGEVIVLGPLTANLAVSAGITPSFAINALQATLL